MKLPRFSLRELFLLIVIAAMGCGWWVDQTRINQERAELREEERMNEEKVSGSIDFVLSMADSVEKNTETLNAERAKLGLEPIYIYPLSKVKQSFGVP